jgi:hypothetical protein
VKLRLLDDSIRLRLSQSDVVAADREGFVEAQTAFPDGSVFKFALRSSADGKASAEFKGGRMLVGLPASDISRWANDDTAVSILEELELPGGGQLKLLVEKDFQCLIDRPDEDQSDLFQNPDSSAC